MDKERSEEMKGGQRITLYTGEPRDRFMGLIAGRIKPFVEINTDYKQVYLGVRGVDTEREYSIRVDGVVSYNGFDPIGSYRAVRLLDRFEDIQDPLIDLKDTLLIASGSISKENYMKFVDRVSPFLDRDEIENIRRMTPPNLEQDIDLLRQHNIILDGSALAAEIRRGRIESNPLFEQIIQETEERVEKLEEINTLTPLDAFLIE